MTQYIPKSAVVVEIERRIKSASNDVNIGAIESLIISKTLNGFKSFLDTLEVKEVDLNKELSYEDYKGFFEKYPGLSDDWGFDETWMFAKYFFELGLSVSNKQIEEKEHINSPEEESNIVYKNITMINMDGNIVKSKIEQREKV